MKNWEIPVTYEVLEFVNVNANTLAEAMAIAKKKGSILKHRQYIPLNKGLLFDDVNVVREIYNNNQKDLVEVKHDKTVVEYSRSVRSNLKVTARNR